jgi:hypothetical protein
MSRPVRFAINPCGLSEIGCVSISNKSKSFIIFLILSNPRGIRMLGGSCPPSRASVVQRYPKRRPDAPYALGLEVATGEMDMVCPICPADPSHCRPVAVTHGPPSCEMDSNQPLPCSSSPAHLTFTISPMEDTTISPIRSGPKHEKKHGPSTPRPKVF